MLIAPNTEQALRAQNIAAAATYQFYERHAAEYFERTVAADMSHLYDRFLAMVEKGGRILDVGCGSGRDLRVFLERGYRVMGIDASRPLVELANHYSGAPCIVGHVEEITYETCFDGIWACAVLLHLPKVTLGLVLHRLRRALVPNGVIYVSVQAGTGEESAPDGRFYSYYQPAELICAIERAGFDVKDSWSSHDILPERASTRWINVLAKPSSGAVTKLIQDSP